MTAAAAVGLRRLTSDGRVFAVVLFLLLTVLVFIDGRLSMALIHYVPAAEQLPIPSWFDAYARYDSGWYHSIADRGYYYAGRDQQSSVAFFPAYPAAMRAVGTVLFGHLAVGGMVVTLASGLGIAVLFFRWVEGFLGPATARLALVLLLCYPFAFYLFGVVYSDALFVVAALGAFFLLERDRPLLAAVVGIVATAARPVGVALVVGLFLRSLELHGVLPRAPGALLPRRIEWRRLRLVDFAPALSMLGLFAFCALLWARFDDPLVFTKVSAAPGWWKSFDLDSVLKIHLFRLLDAYGLNLVTFWLVVQGLLSLVAMALVPSVIRRFGWGYGAYVLVAVGIAFASTRDFIGMGRYVLAAFPAFAAGADLLLRLSARHRGLPGPASAMARAAPAVVVVVSAGLLAWMVSLFARWHFLS